MDRFVYINGSVLKICKRELEIGVSGKETRVSSFARLKCTALRSGLAEIHLPFYVSQVRKAGKQPSQKQFWKGVKRKGGEKCMGIFDPLEVITEYSLREAIEDGMLVEIFKNRWKQLSGGKPIVCSINLYENVSKASLMEIWNEFVDWENNVCPGLPLNERNFQTEVSGMFVWVIDDGVCFTLLYPEDY